MQDLFTWPQVLLERWREVRTGSSFRQWKTCRPGSRRKLPSQLNYHGPPGLHYVVCYQKGVLQFPCTVHTSYNQVSVIGACCISYAPSRCCCFLLLRNRKHMKTHINWASSQENLSSEFPSKRYSNQSP